MLIPMEYRTADTSVVVPNHYAFSCTCIIIQWFELRRKCCSHSTGFRRYKLSETVLNAAAQQKHEE